MPKTELADLEQTLDVTFQNKDTLQQALVHRSYLNEHPDFRLGHNERLEFLGDAVLELVIT
ncbi:MAG: ribonuclease III, partial [Patescibacteria group bacterium]